ncbi:hypothetical protein CR203_23950 [Salipaludibacillus neizhouensis]|uniref:Uncharacterized protein n=1 Tax=Salipaludibacillus neizhouensis TaxID=885475 RepID=A0A3A9K0W9_9BACI|nr:hypothetical protein [Salipaludibacillus neizhouensis]RKL64878.1 hypothetical protein CR203_23950 [Salipaludibacillus neizhouensis]
MVGSMVGSTAGNMVDMVRNMVVITTTREILVYEKVHVAFDIVVLGYLNFDKLHHFDYGSRLYNYRYT